MGDAGSGQEKSPGKSGAFLSVRRDQLVPIEFVFKTGPDHVDVQGIGRDTHPRTGKCSATGVVKAAAFVREPRL